MSGMGWMIMRKGGRFQMRRAAALGWWAELEEWTTENSGSST